MNILYKDKLLEIIKYGKIKISNQVIELIYVNGNKITIFFDKKNQDLKGWQIVDQYNNGINFSLKIISKNDKYAKEIFVLPKIN